MKNYLGRLGLRRGETETTIKSAMELATQETLDAKSLGDAETVLLDPVKRTYYERTHLQYEAIKAALSTLHWESAMDTHRWPERLVEFNSPDLAEELESP